MFIQKALYFLFYKASKYCGFFLGSFFGLAIFYFRRTPLFTEFAFSLSIFPFSLGEWIRFYFYKITLDSLGNNVIFRFGSFCQYSNIKIGNNITFGVYNAIGYYSFGNDITCGGFINFISGKNQHSFQNANEKIIDQISKGRSLISIGSDIWIGSNSIILSDISDRVVIGAGSVLLQKAESFGVYAGNPAKKIKIINE